METDIFLDNDIDDDDQQLKRHADLLPYYVWNVFGYEIPIYEKIGWFRRFAINLIFGSNWRKVR